MKAFTAILRSQAVPIAIAIGIFLLSALWLRGNHYRDARDLWKSTAQTQAEATRMASVAAAVWAETARIKTETRYAAHARKADNEEPTAVSDLRASADRYADARRLHKQPQTDCGLPGIAAKAAPDSPAPDRDGPGADAMAKDGADFIAVPRAHFNQLRDNTLRLERVRLWGDGLIADGLAVMDGEHQPP